MSDASCDPDEESVKDMIDFLEHMDHDVSSWEAEFLDSIMKQRRAGQSLSPNQRAKLEEIWEEYQNKTEFDRDDKDD